MDQKIISRMLSPWVMRFYFFNQLPGAWFFGLKIKVLDHEKCVVQIPYRWSTKNPFRSIYFAALSAAAELSTGSIALAAVEGKDMSMLVTGMSGVFLKKAKGIILFECPEVPRIVAAVKEAESNPNGSVVSVTTFGHNKDGVEVAKFTFEWSFKKKSA
ncbi:MAG: DUF4442 domain-containing protein [Saprospiraceae bacterium]